MLASGPTTEVHGVYGASGVEVQVLRVVCVRCVLCVGGDVWCGKNTGQSNRKQKQPNTCSNRHRPEGKISTAHHIHINALSVLLSRRGQASGRAGRAANGIARRHAQSAYRGRGGGTAGRSTRWGEAWQAWQGSGNMLATKLANRTLLDLLRGWLAAAIAFVRGVCASPEPGCRLFRTPQPLKALFHNPVLFRCLQN